VRFVPTLKTVLALVVAGTALYGIVFYFVVAGAPYREARAFIRSHPTVTKELGSVIDIHLSWLSSASVSGNSGTAALRCPVQGSAGTATAYIDLRREAGVWNVVRANLVMDARSIPLM
jgi:hypothetical protein